MPNDFGTIRFRPMPAMSDEEAPRFNRTLMEFDELSQSILKGHLMIEEQLTAILEHLVGRGGPVGDALDEVRLSFSRRPSWYGQRILMVAMPGLGLR